MTLVDTNILIYATFADVRENARARDWLDSRLSEDNGGGVVFCWPVLYAYLRLVTSSRVFRENALSVDQGWSVVADLLNQPVTRVISPGPGHAAIAADLARTPGLRSDDVPDIEIAALAIEHGLRLASHDNGFRRFSGLRTFDPILESE
ncbi:MAG: PIN domain-containing protein [Actinobacteria bacterium]|nr:PIN domain-containing protein [Actinomycetota bacterium]